MVGWLAAWLTGWLAGWLAGWMDGFECSGRFYRSTRTVFALLLSRAKSWRSVHGRSTAFFHSCKRSGTFQDEGDEKKSLREYEHGKSEEDFEFRGEQLRAFILPYAEEKMIQRHKRAHYNAVVTKY
ncbi:hypothetical protein V1477_016239 [Vespula maculifrons]|uniref:Uncharacterized protein n=1 Tax=Vespula maculifrons TaxID=7453 RepID=A0ABD2BD50_VESMC